MDNTTIKPITPDEVSQEKAKAKAKAIPDFVINAVNLLIGKHWNGHEAVIQQSEIVSEIKKAWPTDSPIPASKHSSVIVAEHWLDFEVLYEDAGWSVDYDKPAYNEDYPATFRFSRPRTNRR